MAALYASSASVTVAVGRAFAATRRAHGRVAGFPRASNARDTTVVIASARDAVSVDRARACEDDRRVAGRDGTRRALFRLVNETNDESRDEMVEESIPLKFELFRVASFLVLRLALLRARVIGHHVGKIFARGGGALLGDGALVRGANRRLVL